MSILTGQQLLDAGWRPGPKIGRMLAAAAKYEARGIHDSAYLLKLLARDFDKDEEKLRLRDHPPAFTEALEAETTLDESNLAAVRRFMGQLLRSPVIEAGTVMPDACPAGSAEATIPVGGAIAVRQAIVPAAHSADICCSMHATVFESGEGTGAMLDALMSATRFGFGGRREEDRVDHPVLREAVWSNPFLHDLEDHAARHLADQGDGNHFAFLGRLRVDGDFVRALSGAGHDDLARSLHDASAGRLDASGGRDFHVLVTHHGSRGLGAQVYARGQKAAIAETARVAEGIPAAAAWLDTGTPEGADYWEALQYVSRWTAANHQCIHQRFLDRLGLEAVAAFGNEHNFVWKRGDSFLHGKGATPAWKDDAGRPLLGLIPLNMAAPILVTLGLDNPEFLGFAPHGAGRNRSRTATLSEFRQSDGGTDEGAVERAVAGATKGLDIRWYYGRPDLTESPLGYKPAAQIRRQIKKFRLASVVAEITPLGCIMAGDAGPAPWRRKDELTPKQKRQMEHRADRRRDRQSLRHWEDRDDEA